MWVISAQIRKATTAMATRSVSEMRTVSTTQPFKAEVLRFRDPEQHRESTDSEERREDRDGQYELATRIDGGVAEM